MCNCIDVLGGIVPPPNLPCIGRYCTLQPLKFHQLFRCLRFGKSLDDNDHDGNEDNDKDESDDENTRTGKKVHGLEVQYRRRSTIDQLGFPSKVKDCNLLDQKAQIYQNSSPGYLYFSWNCRRLLAFWNTIQYILKASGSGNLARQHHDYGGSRGPKTIVASWHCHPESLARPESFCA